jgi:hypothetical protein
MNDLTAVQQAAANEQALEDAFTNTLTKILDFTPFSEDWVVEDEGEKYIFAIIHHPLAIGEVGKSQTEDGRRIIMVGTRVGVVAMCETNALGHGPFALDVHAPESLDFFIGAMIGDLITLEILTRVVNQHNISENIGHHMDKLERVMAVHRRVKTRTLERAEEAELFGHAHRGPFRYSENSVVEEHEGRMYANLTGFKPQPHMG